ncbi:MAG: hypothetical protein D6695_02980 [Planctomycetota bacterium]|nr:MAG: hypothetical protein D6695_02980 [Planctomycetota bacterium]
MGLPSRTDDLPAAQCDRVLRRAGRDPANKCKAGLILNFVGGLVVTSYTIWFGVSRLAMSLSGPP